MSVEKEGILFLHLRLKNLKQNTHGSIRMIYNNIIILNTRKAYKIQQKSTNTKVIITEQLKSGSNIICHIFEQTSCAAKG